MQQEDLEAVVILDDGMLQANVRAIAALATRRDLLSIGNKELTQAGGLSGYGLNFFTTFRRAAALVDKILKGTKPADIPIERATTFEFVLNLKTARSLGLTIPPTLLARADEVIESARTIAPYVALAHRSPWHMVDGSGAATFRQNLGVMRMKLGIDRFRRPKENGSKPASAGPPWMPQRRARAERRSISLEQADRLRLEGIVRIGSWVSVVALTLSIALTGAAAQAPQIQDNAPTNAQSARGTWTEERPLSSPRVEVAAAAIGRALHVVGGNRNGMLAETTHEAYDPSTNAWRMLAPLPEARDHVAVAATGGKLFAFGGFATPVHKGASADSFEYDPSADRWRRLPPMPTARGSAGAAVVNGNIHVIGGRSPDGVTLAAHEIYDPQSGQWITAASLPVARDHLTVVAVDGTVHVVGGRRSTPIERVDRHDIYDPATGQWSPGAPLPTPRSGVAGVVYAGMILVLGGELPGHTFPENEGFEPRADRWSALAPMPHGRHGFGGGVIGKDAYFVGGSLISGDGGATDQLIKFRLP